jgi:hypothetical protein
MEKVKLKNKEKFFRFLEDEFGYHKDQVLEEYYDEMIEDYIYQFGKELSMVDIYRNCSNSFEEDDDTIYIIPNIWIKNYREESFIVPTLSWKDYDIRWRDKVLENILKNI